MLRPTRLLALGALVLVGAALLEADPQLPAHEGRPRPARGRGRRLEVQQKQLKTRIATVGTGPDLVREARRLGFVKPGEQLFIVRGIAAWRARRTTNLERWTTSRSSSGSSGGRRARSGASPCAARTVLPAVVEQAAVRRERRAVPDPVLAHLPPPRCPDRAARGRRRRRALDGGGAMDPELAASLARAHAEQRRAPARAARRRRRRDAARAASSACTPTPRSRSPGPGTCSATGSSPRPGRSGPGTLLLDSMIGRWRGRRARAPQWAEGAARVERARWDRGAYARLNAPDRAVTAELTRRIGQNFTLDELARVYERRGPLGARGDRRCVPGRGAGPTSRRRPTPRSTSTRAARPTTRRDGHPATAAAAAGAAAGRGSSPAQPGSWSSSSPGVGLGEALHDNPQHGRNADARADAPPASARPGRAEHGHRHGHQPVAQESRRFG